MGNCFRRAFRKELTLNRVRDHVTFKEGNDTLPLVVDCDANTIISRLLEAKKGLDGITGESTAEEREAAARAFSEAIFGKEQTQKIFEFYSNDPGCVVTICGMYFGDAKNGLGKKITKVQKHTK